MAARKGATQGRKPAGDPDRDNVARIIAALEYVAKAPAAVTARGMSEALGIPRATAYRIFSRLEQERILVPEPGGRDYYAGKRLSELAVAALTNSTHHGARHRVLQRLVDELGETCNLTTLCGSEVVYIDRVETDWPLRMHLNPGSRVPVHCTATGKLLLSLLPERRRTEIVMAASLRSYTERTITDADRLLVELERIRNDMVGVDDEEFVAGMIAVAVPVVNDRGEPCAALAVHAPKVRMSLEAARQHLPVLREASARLTRLLCGT